MSTALTPRPPQAIERADVARADLAAARAKVRRQLDELEKSLPAVPPWRDVIRRHPLLTIGGAFVVGWAVARWFTKR